MSYYKGEEDDDQDGKEEGEEDEKEKMEEEYEHEKASAKPKLRKKPSLYKIATPPHSPSPSSPPRTRLRNRPLRNA